MKTIIITVGLFISSSYLFAQSDCKYNGSESTIVAELSKRNTNTGKDKLTQEELKKIAGYWVADCKCKKGVATLEEAKKLSNKAFLSRTPSSILQGDGTFYDKDLSVFGDLEPPFTSFHPNWCLKGNNSTGGMTLESGTNCVQESSRLSELDGQLSAYAGQFFVAYCQCINGVPSQEYADNLVATMQSTHKSFDDFRGATPRLSTQPLTSCDIIEGNSSQINNSVASNYTVPPENLQETIMDQYDPQGYAYYSYNKGVTQQGKSLVEGITNQLNDYSELILSSNPNDILADFQSKIQNIEELEAQFVQNSFEYGSQRGAELAQQINSKDYLGGFINAINTLETLADINEADKELAARKRALEDQKLSKFSAIQKEAYQANYNLIVEFYKRAAYSESEYDEKYNLEYVNHLLCFSWKIRNEFSVDNTNWMVNDCSKPVQPEASIPNNLLSSEAKLKQVITRKLNLFEQTGLKVFHKAAIAYAAKLSNANPTADNYFYLGELYELNSSMLAYVALTTAKEIDSKYLDKEKTRYFDQIRKKAIDEINDALMNNDIDYIKAFFKAGLDRDIEIDGRSILHQAISLDNPDAVQVILNQYVSDLNQSEVLKKSEQVIMLSAAENSPKTIKRLSDLGVSTEFKIENKSPIDIAVESNSSEALSVLLKLSPKRASYESKYRLSIPFIVYTASINPELSLSYIDEINEPEKITSLTNQLLKRSLNDSRYFHTILESSKLKSEIQSNTYFESLTSQFLLSELKKTPSESKASLVIEHNLIKINTAFPTIVDLLKMSGSQPSKQVEPLNLQEKIKYLKNEEELRKLRNSQYANASSDQLNYVTKYDKYLLNSKSLTNNERALLNLEFFEWLKSGFVNQVIKKEYIVHFINNASNEKISMDNKIQNYIDGLKEMKRMGWKNLESEISRTENQFSNGKLTENSLESEHSIKYRLIKNVYLKYAILLGLPYSSDDVANYFKYNKDFTDIIVFNQHNHLAAIALQINDVTLFKTIYNKLEMSFNKGEQELFFNNLLRASFFVVPEFYKYNVKVSDQVLLKQFELLAKLPDFEIKKFTDVNIYEDDGYAEARAKLMLKILDHVGHSSHKVFEPYGGTLLHWAVDFALNNCNNINVTNSAYKSFFLLKIKDSEKDKNGLTVRKKFRNTETMFANSESGKVLYDSMEYWFKGS